MNHIIVKNDLLVDACIATMRDIEEYRTQKLEEAIEQKMQEVTWLLRRKKYPTREAALARLKDEGEVDYIEAEYGKQYKVAKNLYYVGHCSLEDTTKLSIDIFERIDTFYYEIFEKFREKEKTDAN